MKRCVAAFLAFVMVAAFQPLAVAGLVQNNGEISGTAVVEGKPLAKVTVRLRNVDTGQLVGTTTTNNAGEYRFTGLPGGNYVVETVAPNGTLLGTSAAIALTAGTMVATGVTVTTSAAAAAAAGVGAGAAAAGAAAGGAAAGGAAAGAAAGAAGGFFASTAGLVTIAAASAGVVGAAVATRDEASPSR